MDALSSAGVSKPLWSKAPRQNRATTQLHRKEPAITLPILARRSSGQQSGIPDRSSHNRSLHAFLSAQLENNERENYSRCQLRAMASSKLLSTNNNNNMTRVHSSAERLAPLDPASFEKTRISRRSLPGHLQAAINEILAVKYSSEALRSERGESRDESSNNGFEELIPGSKQPSPLKTQIQSRRPEWQRYIRRIMMTKGIRGSTLARYRRIVGIVARKNLTSSFAGAAERVVRSRLEFRSAAVIQATILKFLRRRQQSRHLQRHQAAVTIQRIYRIALAAEQQQQQVEMARLAEIERLVCLAATRTMQRCYRKYRDKCRLREEQQHELGKANLLQKARLKLLRRYQLWRSNPNRANKSEDDLTITEDNIKASDICSQEMSASNLNTSPDVVEKTGAISPFVGSELAVSDTPMAAADFPEDDYRCAKGAYSLVEHSTSENIVLTGDNSSHDVKFEIFTSGDPADVLLQPDHRTVFTAIATVGVLDSSTEGNNHLESPKSCIEITVDLSPRGPRVSEASFAARVKLREKDENCGTNASTSANKSDEVPIETTLLQQHLLSSMSASDDSSSGLEAASLATALFRAAKAKRIASFLASKLQARYAVKTYAVVRIQSFVRVFLAKQRCAGTRFEILQSLRAQLFAKWHPDAQVNNKIPDKHGIQDHSIQETDEDDQFEMDGQGYNASFDMVSENYVHLLPTRNGQIPPGVPLLQSSAAVPLLSLWKWSWPGEQWLSTGQ
ncbi:unnamed protein product [Phytophthora fragariaefolia]|uniref:Unnamed protein product n=1 Tax=Phytophthora fragariaefolia TaxID=1490495 RepID=A0A9W6XKL6_9STRA|nr:unnamed protein product [Phytophthora fragariaefolia]